MDTLFKALADKNRREILKLLKKRSMNVTELLEHFSITPATLSHHLDALKRADLIVAERRGQFINYSLNESVFQEATELLFNLFKIDNKDEK